MTESTKEKYQRVLDFISYALEHANEVTLQHDAQILVERALTVAANLPSAEEIHNLMAETISEDQPLFKTAARILERIRSVK